MGRIGDDRDWTGDCDLERVNGRVDEWAWSREVRASGCAVWEGRVFWRVQIGRRAGALAASAPLMPQVELQLVRRLGLL